jgi:type I restriction enzyme, S subunit
LYYFLRTQYQVLRTISTGDGTRGGLNLKMIKDFEIPVPPVKVQLEIVRLLRQYDSLVNDISQGLPAEILRLVGNDMSIIETNSLHLRR